MILSLFRKDRDADAALALYRAIVAQSRQPRFYAQWSVPDTVTGRFDVLSLHMALVFRRLKRQLDAYARSHGFSASIETLIDSRGLVIRLLTDDVVFDSGSATLKPEAAPLLAKISALVNVDASHPISVGGHTDDVPIATGRFPSNWELSAARAAGVARFLTGHGVAATRLEATGVADQRPIATNTTEEGRSRNRRVEIALLRGGVPEGGLVP